MPHKFKRNFRSGEKSDGGVFTCVQRRNRRLTGCSSRVSQLPNRRPTPSHPPCHHAPLSPKPPSHIYAPLSPIPPSHIYATMPTPLSGLLDEHVLVRTRHPTLTLATTTMTNTLSHIYVSPIRPPSTTSLKSGGKQGSKRTGGPPAGTSLGRGPLIWTQAIGHFRGDARLLKNRRSSCSNLSWARTPKMDPGNGPLLG